MFKSSLLASAAFALTLAAASGGAMAMSAVSTNSGVALTGALVPNPGAFSSINVSQTVGLVSQVGTYSGFNLAPVTIADGVVISSGLVTQTTAAFHSASDTPSNSLGGGSTAEINAYAPGNIANWSSSQDTSQISISFTLAAPSAVAFDFLFGSIEYPNFVNNYTDAMYAFLDGSQISFDANGDPVQVGGSFASSLTTADNNSAFADPHGLIGKLTTTSGTLAAGDHTLNIAVADTNDQQLDSAAFLTNFRLSNNDGGPVTTPTGVPEPASMALLGAGLALLGAARRRR